MTTIKSNNSNVLDVCSYWDTDSGGEMISETAVPYSYILFIQYQPSEI